MSFDYSTLITDRTRSDSDTLKTLLRKPMAEWTAEERTAFNGAVMKGSYDYTDLNRVGDCLEDLVARLGRVGRIVPGYERVKIPRAVTPSSHLPEGYTEVQYIQSSGAQYVDTGFRPNQASRVDMLAQMTAISNYPAFFGTRAGSKELFWLYANDAETAIYGYGSVKPRATCTMTDLLAIKADANTLYVNEDVLITATASTFETDFPLYLFATNNSGSLQYPAKMKMFSCTMYDRTEKIHDFIPCKNAAGAVGLYDVIGAKFYGNAGTGSFTAGPVVTLETAPEEPTETLDPYTWYESDVPVPSQMARYRANVAAVRAALRLPDGTPEAPETMRRLTTAEANSIEAILLALNLILNQIHTAVRHCGVTVCGGKGVRA